ncbi:MAG TPA: FAD-dependent monooxygenase [Steroidobacteraceae bacterium]|nr:FAD-dependent monooxygenase [Steroidobacteraceae bacterium]
MLIVGAGPTGLVLALWLTKYGLRVRIIDKLAASGTTSRALAVQARTLEYYQQMGLDQAVVERGHKVPALNLWVKRRQAARVSLENLGQGLTPFPYPIIFPQDQHEMLLIERLRKSGVEVERQLELVAFEDAGAAIRATLRAGDGEQICTCAYLAGCDGARSKVREILNSGFPGGTYDHLFYVADVEAAGPPMNGELHVDLEDADFLAVFPLSQSGNARLIGSVRDDAARDHEQLRFEDVQGRAIDNLKVQIKRVNWFSTYRVHHRVAQQFRKGRAFLLGDAAHIHSPVGGQGMNTGLGDAVNLAWKLAAAIKQPASAALLDSYQPERIAFARRLVATTDRAFTAVISSSAFARFVRTRLIPAFAPALLRVPAMRRLTFRTVSQIAVNYRDGSFNRGRAGKLCGGDRLPWVCTGTLGGEFNFAALKSMDWQMHVYGEPAPALRALCERRTIPLHVFAWRPPMKQAGLRRNAWYLVRPDGYVALADAECSAAAITGFLDENHINPRTMK